MRLVEVLWVEFDGDIFLDLHELTKHQHLDQIAEHQPEGKLAASAGSSE